MRRTPAVFVDGGIIGSVKSVGVFHGVVFEPREDSLLAPYRRFRSRVDIMVVSGRTSVWVSKCRVVVRRRLRSRFDNRRRYWSHPASVYSSSLLEGIKRCTV